jgi:hypothetical protein
MSIARPFAVRLPVTLLVATLSVGALAGCSDAAPVGDIMGPGLAEAPPLPESSKLLGEFVMHVDPRAKKLSIERVRRDDGMLDPQSIDDLNINSDGVTGSGPQNTVEMVTNSYNEGTACPSGTTGVWCANVTLRSFYTQPLSNVFVQVTSITLNAQPIANHNATNSDPSEFGLDAAKGLWKYTATAATNPGVLGTSPNNDGARDWEFNDPDGAAVDIQLRVVSSLKFASYTFDFSNESYTDACSGGTAVTAASGSATMPFPFTLYGSTNSTVKFNRLGQITFGSVSGTASGTNVALPSTTAPKPAIYAFWDSVTYGSGGKMCYKTIGSAPNRKFVLTWQHLKFSDLATSDLNFSALLSEGTNQIDIAYGSMTGDGTAAGEDRAAGSGATVGVQNEAGSLATAEYNTPNYGTGNAYAYVPVP